MALARSSSAGRFISRVSMAPLAWSLRLRFKTSLARDGPARFISVSITRSWSALVWRGPFGCKAIRPRRRNAHVRTSRMPSAGTIPLPLAHALSWAPGIAWWIGDFRDLEQHADRLISHAQSHSLGPYLAVGRGYKSILAIRRSDTKNGDLRVCRGCLSDLHAARYEILNSEFKLALVQGLMAIGQFDEAQ